MTSDEMTSHCARGCFKFEGCLSAASPKEVPLSC